MNKNDYIKNNMQQMRLLKEKERIKNVVDQALASNKPIKSSSIFISPEHFRYNPKISHEERKQLFDDIMKYTKVPNDITVENDHHPSHTELKLEIPESSRLPAVQKENFAPASQLDAVLSPNNARMGRIIRNLTVKKTDPQTKLPGTLFNKNSNKDAKFDSCVRQVSAKKSKNAAYAICRAVLKKKQSKIMKDDKPHLPNTPEHAAHEVAEHNKPFMEAVDSVGRHRVKDFLQHLKTLVDRSQHRSPKNKK